MIAGGVESMSRAPFVMPQGRERLRRRPKIYDTTIGWRFVNPRMEAAIRRRSRCRRPPKTSPTSTASAATTRTPSRCAASNARLGAQRPAASPRRSSPVTIPQGPRRDASWSTRRAPARHDARGAGKLQPAVPRRRHRHGRQRVRRQRRRLCADRRVRSGSEARTASRRGRGSSVRRGRWRGAARHGHRARCRRPAGCMREGGPRRSTEIDIDRAQRGLRGPGARRCLRELGLPDERRHVNPNGGAIALGHPLGMSGARLVTTAMYELHKRRQAATRSARMCIGVGQGIAMMIERV